MRCPLFHCVLELLDWARIWICTNEHCPYVRWRRKKGRKTDYAVLINDYMWLVEVYGAWTFFMMCKYWEISCLSERYRPICEDNDSYGRGKAIWKLMHLYKKHKIKKCKKGGGVYWADLYIQYISGSVYLCTGKGCLCFFILFYFLFFSRGSTLQFTIFEFSSKFDLHVPVFLAQSQRH